MALALSNSVSLLSGVGDKVQTHLEQLGICTIEDLLRHYPRYYIDASNLVAIARIQWGQVSAIHGTVQRIVDRRSNKTRVPMLEVYVTDDSGEMLLRFFHQPFLKQKLLPGTSWVFIGIAQRFQGVTVMLSPLVEDTATIMPVYPQTKGVNSKLLRKLAAGALVNTTLPPHKLPYEVVDNRKLPQFDQVMKYLHQPDSMEQVELAHRYLAFEEVFWFFAGMSASKEEWSSAVGVKIDPPLELVKKIVADLPFSLTNGQKRAIWDSLQEMDGSHPMTRLLNGDVGSGKTAVAATLLALVVHYGHTGIFLAPTEILARQHYETLKKLLAVPVSLWVASEKQEQAGPGIVVGTHAVLYEQFMPQDVALVVVDEQHRFGVKQRHLLREKLTPTPHLLSMTATPIPRTLALTLYGDLEVSFLPEKPQGRPPVVTEIIKPADRNRMYGNILAEIKKGHQVFVICPLIEEKEEKTEDEGQLQIATVAEQQQAEKKSVLKEVERLKKEMPELGVIVALHGKMKAEEKARIMQEMEAGNIQVLVATTLLEVGIDIPNATVMVIESVQQFGLAQIHQLRGRVGRGEVRSTCYLCPTLHNQKTEERLKAVVESRNGFELAEKDLELRGPGQLSGEMQSGLPDFRMTSLADSQFLQEVREVVQWYAERNPHFLLEQRQKLLSQQLQKLE